MVDLAAPINELRASPTRTAVSLEGTLLQPVYGEQWGKGRTDAGNNAWYCDRKKARNKKCSFLAECSSKQFWFNKGVP